MCLKIISHRPRLGQGAQLWLPSELPRSQQRSASPVGKFGARVGSVWEGARTIGPRDETRRAPIWAWRRLLPHQGEPAWFWTRRSARAPFLSQFCSGGSAPTRGRALGANPSRPPQMAPLNRLSAEAEKTRLVTREWRGEVRQFHHQREILAAAPPPQRRSGG